MDGIWVVSVLIFVDSVVSFVCGFGMSTLLIPILLLWYPVHVVLVLVGFLHLVSNLNKVLLLTQAIDWKLFSWLGIPAICMSVAGAYLTSYIPRDLFLRILGLVLLVYVLVSLFYEHIKFPRKPLFSLFAGGVYGFIEGLTGIGGVMRVSLFYAYTLPPAVFIATSGFLALLVDVARVGTYLRAGMPDVFMWWHYVLFVTMATAGSVAGRSLINVLPARFIRYLIVVAIVLVSIKFVVAP